MRDQLNPLLATLEQQHRLPPGLLAAVAQTESAWNPRAVSPAGAMGLFQFMPATAREYGIDPFNPEQAASAAARKLRGLIDRYQGDTTRALQAYNWGEGNMASGKPMPRETQAYAPKVMAAMGKQQQPKAEDIAWDAPSQTSRIDPNGIEWDKPAAQPAKPKGDTGRDIAAGLLRGAGSIGATILAPIDAAARALNDGKPVNIGGYDIVGQDRRAMMDQALQSAGADTNSLAFKGSKLWAEIAGTMGVGGAIGRGLSAAAPQAAAKLPNLVQAIQTSGMRGGNLATRAAGAALTGGASATLVDPQNAAGGVAIGAAMPVVGRVAGAAGSALGGALSPRVNNPELARKAVNEYGIPLAVSDISGNRVVRAARAILDDAPLTGGMGAKQAEAVQEGFNRAVGRTFGADAPKLTPEVLDQAKGRIGAELDRLWGQNRVPVDQDFAAVFNSLKGEIDKLPQGEAARLQGWLRDLVGKVQEGPDGFFIPGDVANRFQSALRREAEKATGFLKDSLGTLRRGVIDAFNRGAKPEDAEALRTALGQYKAMKTVTPVLQSAEAGVAGRTVGDVPAALLPNAVRQSYRGGIAGSPFEDLTQIGSQYLVNRTPQTGGSLRAAMQTSAILGGGALSLANPLAALTGATGGLLAQRALTSPALGRLALRQQTANPLLQMLAQQAGQIGYRGAPIAFSGQFPSP